MCVCVKGRLNFRSLYRSFSMLDNFMLALLCSNWIVNLFLNVETLGGRGGEGEGEEAVAV